MNRILSKFSLVIASTLITAGVWAQTQTATLRAKIPFDFMVNNKVLPAGTYILKSEGATHTVVELSDATQKGAQVFEVVSPEATKQGQKNALVFHKYGDRYFLSEIRCENYALNSSLPESKAEKWAKTQTQDAAVTQWPAGDILIALK